MSLLIPFIVASASSPKSQEKQTLLEKGFTEKAD
jgi:hypothetical protein